MTCPWIWTCASPGPSLADVGKLLEYDLDENGESCKSDMGKYVRHPFSGVGLAMEAGVPPQVCHIIAAHAGEGNMVTRSTEAYIVPPCGLHDFPPLQESAVTGPIFVGAAGFVD